MNDKEIENPSLFALWSGVLTRLKEGMWPFGLAHKRNIIGSWLENADRTYKTL